MSSFPPLDVKVSSKKLSCVLDVQVALSPYGLLLASRLAGDLNVWLVRTLWQILDNNRFYLDNPHLLLPHQRTGPLLKTSGGRDHCVLTDMLQQWESARLDADLAGLCVYWAGDSRCDSLLPEDVDKRVVERFETLAAELDTLWQDPRENNVIFDPLRECWRDAAALSTALLRYRPILFTLTNGAENSETGEPEPGVSAFLRQCGIDCQRVRNDRYARAARHHLQSMFARCGVADLFWAGLDLAALHIVAPRAFIMPEDKALDEELDSPAPISNNRGHWFDGAAAFWWRVNET